MLTEREKGGERMTAIYKYRKALDITQKQLGDLIGVTPNAITQYETGARKPDIITLKKLAVALHCTTDQLLEPIEV